MACITRVKSPMVRHLEFGTLLILLTRYWDWIVYALYATLPESDPMGAASRFMVSAWVAFANTLNPNRPYRTSPFSSPSTMHPESDENG